jgi:single-stranded-DNA-specific exonuclease
MRTPRIERRTFAPSPDPWPEKYHPVLQRIYASRGICSPLEIAHRLAELPHPESLGGIRVACQVIEDAIRRDARIVIVGDFDADGATGTAVAVRGLRGLGANNVGYRVPNRFTHGYGLTVPLVEELRLESPDLLITVDNGIASHAGIAAAKQAGINVVVTDHHLAGASLPLADAIVNPNATRVERCGHGDSICSACAHDLALNAAFPGKSLAGVGVMFYLLLALRARLRANGWFAYRGIDEFDLSNLLDLVALGTVADLVPLDRNNRTLVEAGLKRMRNGRACAGVTALVAAGNRDLKRLVASDLGFVLAPRINAAGRLDDMSLGIECLITDDPSRARDLAETLSTMNAERRELQGSMVEQAEASVKKWISQHGESGLPVGLVLFEPEWHHGVVGLVASRLKEMLQRPVIACAPSSDASGEIKASGRSIAGFHLRDALAEVETRSPGVLQRFGGHAMAAGMTLHRGDLDRFSAAFDAVARDRIAPHQLEAVVLSDGELSSEDFSLELADQLRTGGPWGQAFPEPVFDGVFDLDSWRTVGECHWRLKLRAKGIERTFDAMLFNAMVGEKPPSSMRATFQLTIDEWSGSRSLRLLLRHISALEEVG